MTRIARALRALPALIPMLSGCTVDKVPMTAPQMSVVSASTSSGGINVAAAANGATVLASSSYSSGYAPASAIDGERKGMNWGAGGGWNDATIGSYPDWLEVDFAGSQTIDEVDVYTLQDNFVSPLTPALNQTFALYGLTDFRIEAWNGTSWVAVPNGTISGNTQVWRQVTFAPLTTTRIRVWITGALSAYSRVTEIEAYTVSSSLPAAFGKGSPTNATALSSSAVTLTWPASTGATSYEYCIDTTNNSACDATWVSTTSLSATLPSVSSGTSYYWQVRARNAAGTTDADAGAWWSFSSTSNTGTRLNVAAASNGATAFASSSYSSGYAPSAAIDGERKGVIWGSGGGWNDANAGAYPDWLEVDFAGSQTIDEVDVFTLQDNFASPVTPTLGQTFTQYGLTDFRIEAWNGSSWVVVPNGTITGNTQVWRQLTFAPVTTSKIRLWVTGALNAYSRVTEIEAYATGAIIPPPTAVAPSTVALPRVYLDGMLSSARNATAARTIVVTTAAKLQAALDTSRRGDEIVLQAGTSYVGNFTLRRKSGSGWITIRSNSTQLPPAGTRIRPSNASLLPKIVASNQWLPAIQTELAADSYRLVGLEITGSANATSGYSLVALGSAGADQNTTDKQAFNLVLDRVYVHGTPAMDFQRCIYLNSASTAIVDSWISECHSRVYDSQAILGVNGSGPYKIANNYLEAAGENVMFGGGDPKILNGLPADIEIRGNHFFKPLTWQGVWAIKNLFELKMGLRVLVEGNVFENCWQSAQSGFAILLKSANEGGSAPWSQTADVTFRSNIVRNVAHGINAIGRPDDLTAIPMSRVYIGNNLFERVGTGDFAGGRLWYVASVDDVTLENNTGFGVTHGLLLDGAAQRLTIRNNVFGTSQQNWGTWDFAVSSANGLGMGINALNGHYASWTMTNNLFAGVTAALYPNNAIASSILQVGFVSYPNDLRLSATSTFLTSSSQQGAPGVNFTVLNQLTGGVVVTP